MLASEMNVVFWILYVVKQVWNKRQMFCRRKDDTACCVSQKIYGVLFEFHFQLVNEVVCFWGLPVLDSLLYARKHVTSIARSE